MSPYLTMPSRLSGVIFDCDGVILNSRNANAVYYNMILQALDLPPLTKEQEAYTYMATVRQSLEHITPRELHSQLPDICRTAVNYQRDIMPLVTLEEGLLDFINWLNAHKVRMAVHTNRSSGMPIVLDSFRLHPYFDPVVTAAMVRPKPHPEGVFYVLAQWGMAPEEIIFIGDSLNDAQTARAAGVSFVLYGAETLDAAVQVDTFTQLTDIHRPLVPATD